MFMFPPPPWKFLDKNREPKDTPPLLPPPNCENLDWGKAPYDRKGYLRPPGLTEPKEKLNAGLNEDPNAGPREEPNPPKPPPQPPTHNPWHPHGPRTLWQYAHRTFPPANPEITAERKNRNKIFWCIDYQRVLAIWTLLPQKYVILISYLLKMRQLITLNEIWHERVKGHRYRLERRGLYKSNSYLDYGFLSSWVGGDSD